MDSEEAGNGARSKLSIAARRRWSPSGWLALALCAGALPAHATPPPPHEPALLRQARMVATVRLIEAKNGQVSKITELCKVSGKIPVYADSGSAASFYPGELAGCSMPWKGKRLAVSVQGAKAMSKDGISYATATASATPPDAVPLCSICAPQPLADSRAEIRASGSPRTMRFSLNVNPVSMLNARPSVWLEADVEITD